MKVSRVNEMRDLDNEAIEKYRIPEEILMENAGAAVYQALEKHYPVKGKRFVIFCGSGNNGGDGMVVARKIHSNRGQAIIWLIGSPEKYGSAARFNYQIARKLSLDIRQIEDIQAIRKDIYQCDVIIDAIFGTGLEREVGSVHKDIIDLINRSKKPVISVDIPSGVNGNTGEIMGTAIQANLTVTFGLPKIGNLLYPGCEMGGKLYLSHISFPPILYDSPAMKIAVNDTPSLPPRKMSGHKGEFGQALFIAGAAGYYGAPALSALAFLKAGGGYSRLATPASVAPVIAVNAAEVVFLPQKETSTGSLALINKADLLQIANRLDITVLGPGISLNAETSQLARELTAEITGPLLIDGDGISAVCANPDLIQQRNAPTVLTPHLGEMARLMGIPIEEIRRDTVAALQETAIRLHAFIVLKGAHTLIGFPNGEVYINLSGNSGMGTAGSGDVLTGAIAAMYGLGLPLADAVRKGVFIHGAAGDLAAIDKGEDGITARDIMEYLPKAVTSDRNGFPDELRERYSVQVIG